MSLLFTGDLFLEEEIVIDFPLDIVITNFEYVLSNSGNFSENKVNLKCSKNYLSKYSQSSTIYANLANNHIGDFGILGLQDTIKQLDNDGIIHFGSDLSKNSDCITIDYEGHRIGVYTACCLSTHPSKIAEGDRSMISILDRETVVDQVMRYKAEVDYLVVMLHWGNEEIDVPKPEDVNIARAIVDAGANLVVGHHAHVIQSMEVYNGSHIFYGLGNFSFPDLDCPANWDGSQFTSRYIKKNFSWNNESIIVELDKSLNVTFTLVCKYGNRVKKVGGGHKFKEVIMSRKKYDEYILKRRKELQRGKFLQSPSWAIGKVLSKFGM